MPYSDRELNAVLQDLAKRYSAAAKEILGCRLISIALFGSVARGQARPSSDIDLYVVLSEAPSGMLGRRHLLDPVRQSLASELEALWDQGIYADFVEVIRSRHEAERFHPLYLDMSREAILLCDRDHFLKSLLEKVDESLRNGGADRKTMGRFRYWDLSHSSIAERTTVI